MQFVGRRTKKPGGRLCLANTELSTILDRVADAHETLSLRQRVALCVNTRLSAEEALPMADGEISADFLKQKKVTSTHLIIADFKIANLKSRGASMDFLRHEIGYDTVDIVNHPHLAEQFVACFGFGACKDAFCRTPCDAVLLAGSPSQDHLALTSSELLRACNSQKSAAVAVLKQLGPSSLAGVNASDLREQGIGRSELVSANFDLIHLSKTLLGSPEEVARVLDFKF